MPQAFIRIIFSVWHRIELSITIAIIHGNTAPMIDIDLEMIVCLFSFFNKIGIVAQIGKRHTVGICFSDRFKFFYNGAGLS